MTKIMMISSKRRNKKTFLGEKMIKFDTSNRILTLNFTEDRTILKMMRTSNRINHLKVMKTNGFMDLGGMCLDTISWTM